MRSFEILKNSKFLDTTSEKELLCVELLDVLRAVIAYAHTFTQCYDGTFQDARLHDGRKDMESANFIYGAKVTVYNPYIRLSRFCIRHPRFLNLIVELSCRDPIKPNNLT